MPVSDLHYFDNVSSLTGMSILTSFLSKAVSTTILAPLNFVSNRFQVMEEMRKNNLIEEKYKSYSDCFIRSIREENGIKTLWKGNMAKILMSWTGMIFALTAGDYGKREVMKIKKTPQQNALIHSKYLGNLAGLLTSMFSIMITYPFQYAYVRLLADKQLKQKNKSKQFSTISHLFKETLSKDGIRGLYRGVFTSFAGIMLYRVSYFGLYDIWKSQTKSKPNSLFQTFLVGYIITFLAGTISYPLNTIRKRMMMRSLQNQKYRWSVDCLNQILQKQGFITLYRGYPMTLITAISGAGLLMVYENIRGNLSSQTA